VIRIADADADAAVRNVFAFLCSGSLPTSPVS
jgi:hypothetical protein